MKRILPEFEHHTQPLIPMDQFLRRVANSGILVLGIIAVSLVIGIIGYRSLEGLSWMDAFLNSAMLLGGMGPVNTPITMGGKFFAGMYALYCGIVVILVAGIILAPIAHRILHRFHLEAATEEQA
ncbi:hypothetical protein EG834_01430 [bacterium]|nr:hypothetical protein [bacterium]